MPLNKLESLKINSLELEAAVSQASQAPDTFQTFLEGKKTITRKRCLDLFLLRLIRLGMANPDNYVYASVCGEG